MEKNEEHRELFSLPPWAFPVAMLIIGYPAKNASTMKIPRFPTEHVVYENSYRHLEATEFDIMWEGMRQLIGDAPLIKPATNIGQHIYLRKFASEFMVEMNRSVRKGIREWVDGEI